eukprot:3831375-Prymnesium_polylepis.2
MQRKGSVYRHLPILAGVPHVRRRHVAVLRRWQGERVGLPVRRLHVQHLERREPLALAEHDRLEPLHLAAAGCAPLGPHPVAHLEGGRVELLVHRRFALERRRRLRVEARLLQLLFCVVKHAVCAGAQPDGRAVGDFLVLAAGTVPEDRRGGPRRLEQRPAAMRAGRRVRLQRERVVLAPVVGVDGAEVGRRVDRLPEARDAPPIVEPVEDDESAVQSLGGGAVRMKRRPQPVGRVVNCLEAGKSTRERHRQCRLLHVGRRSGRGRLGDLLGCSLFVHHLLGADRRHRTLGGGAPLALGHGGGRRCRRPSPLLPAVAPRPPPTWPPRAPRPPCALPRPPPSWPPP